MNSKAMCTMCLFLFSDRKSYSNRSTSRETILDAGCSTDSKQNPDTLEESLNMTKDPNSRKSVIQTENALGISDLMSDENEEEFSLIPTLFPGWKSSKRENQKRNDFTVEDITFSKSVLGIDLPVISSAESEQNKSEYGNWRSRKRHDKSTSALSLIFSDSDDSNDGTDWNEEQEISDKTSGGSQHQSLFKRIKSHYSDKGSRGFSPQQAIVERVSISMGNVHPKVQSDYKSTTTSRERAIKVPRHIDNGEMTRLKKKHDKDTSITSLFSK